MGRARNQIDNTEAEKFTLSPISFRALAGELLPVVSSPLYSILAVLRLNRLSFILGFGRISRFAAMRLLGMTLDSVLFQSCQSVFRALGAVIGATLVATLDTRGAEAAADHVVTSLNSYNGRLR